MSNTSLPVEYISDTAFLTAHYRAMESDRVDAHFQDPYARVLAGARGEQLAQVMPEGNSVATGCAVRTCVIDELILRAVEKEGIDAVLNLGSGLDTRPYRLPLPTSLHWFESDLPIVLAYKADKLASVKPVCALESVPFDVTDAIAREMLFQRIGTVAKRGLVVTEGLLIYMTPEQVAALAMDLHAQPEFCWWLTDLSSPNGLQQIQKNLGETLTAGEVKMQFAPEEGTEFFRQYGWKTIEFHSFFEEAQRLERGALPQEFLAQLSQENWKILCQMSGFVLLTRAEL
ncbi:MAG: SAM-dependent methyltransferase [Xenococcus sp. MO_188.B8]|nr:SAM-dependent methyltransferase [Xenococcus sp. MO_188.B8]